jgi:hypothetical protein
MLEDRRLSIEVCSYTYPTPRRRPCVSERVPDRARGREAARPGRASHRVDAIL